MNNISVILDITRTHLLSRFKQTAIAGLGVTFGIGTFIILVSFMTGLNGLLDGLILNRTPHIHIYNEIKPSEKQPIDLYKEFQNTFNVVHSIKPKETQVRIHNALPLIDHLRQDERVRGGYATGGCQGLLHCGFYPIEWNGEWYRSHRRSTIVQLW